MNKIVYTIVLLFLFGLLLSELPIIIYKLYPETSDIQYNLFWNSDEKITVLWYIYELSSISNRIIWAFVFCKISIRVSEKLFKIGVVFLGYHISQFVFYMMNRNTTFLSNIIIYLCVILTLIFLVIPDKNRYKYKSIE